VFFDGAGGGAEGAAARPPANPCASASYPHNKKRSQKAKQTQSFSIKGAIDVNIHLPIPEKRRSLLLSVLTKTLSKRHLDSSPLAVWLGDTAGIGSEYPPW